MSRSCARNANTASLMTLCPACLHAFQDAKKALLRRAAVHQQIKDVCTYCQTRYGFDCWALLISYVVFTFPVGTWTMKSYFDQIPDAPIESANIDGASHLRIMRSVVFPMAVPGMISIAIYGFVWSWNDLL